MQRTASVASSGAGTGVVEVSQGIKPRTGLPNSEADDELVQRPSLEAGIFGVLFTLSQEKNQQHIRYRWILLKILLDAWQLFTTIVSPAMGWDINPNSVMWKVIAVLNFGWLSGLPYWVYIAILYSITGLLLVNLALCVWVAWSFKEQKFDYLWPIMTVRGFSYVFIQVFDITSLNFLQLGFSCNYLGATSPRLHMSLYPQYSCSTTPQIIHAIVSGLVLLLFVAVASLVNMSEVEVSPISKSPQALGHSGAEVSAFLIKALLTMVNVFFDGWPKVAAGLYVALTLWLAWVYLRWSPHLVPWVNYLKCGVAVTAAGVAVEQLIVVLLPHSASHVMTITMAVSLGPLFVLGAAASWASVRHFTRAVVKAFQNHDPEAVKPADVYDFSDPRDVEIASRCARVWTDLYTLDKLAVRRADEIVKAGMASFPESAYVAAVRANLMLDMLGFSQTGARQLEAARKLHPSMMVRFMLFVRQQLATQKAASSNVGKNGSMDLLGYVEYQRKQRMVLRHHKDALQAMANFWRILGTSSVSFSSLSKSLEDIDSSVHKAEAAYRVVLEHYSSSTRLVRLYARFLETVKHDPWGAAEFYATANRMEESKDEDGAGPTLPDGTPLSRMDDVEKGVLVVNAFGDIQVANRKLHSMFGYKKGELDGKNVMVIMPAHEAKRHPALLRRYIDSGEKAVPYFRHPVLAMHRERVVFTVRIGVSRASGLGEDSVFIGMLEAVPGALGVGRLWVTQEGVVVAVDPGFVTCFGYHPEDVIGTQLEKLLRSSTAHENAAAGDGAQSGAADAGGSSDVWVASKQIQDTLALVERLLDAASKMHEAPEPPAPVPCKVTHKYDVPKEVIMSVKADFNKTSITEVSFKLLSNEPQLLMVVERKGVIRHMSGDLAKALGVGPADNRVGSRPGGGGGGGGGGGANTVASSQQQGGNAGANVKFAEDQVMLELTPEATQRSLDDFLPAPWRFLHHKHIKHLNQHSNSSLSGAWGCRSGKEPAAAGAKEDAVVGPTMRLLGMNGQPVFVHVNVMSRQQDGQPLHVVRMARSSLANALDERRVRLRVTEAGTVQEVLSGAGAIKNEDAKEGEDDAAQGLFGFPAHQLLGCRIWDFLLLTNGGADASGSGAGDPPKTARGSGPGAEPGGGRGGDGRGAKTAVDVLTEAAAIVSGKSQAPLAAAAAAVAADSDSLSLRVFDQMITNALQSPGISWRVTLVPPTASAEAATLANPARAAALLARRTRQAVLTLHVSLPKAGSANPGQLHIEAELWDKNAITGVLEMDASGRVTGMLEEDIRPAGLLFGVPKEDIVGAPLSSLVRLGPGQSAAGLLTESGVVKKSSLKTKVNDKDAHNIKVGPVHRFEGYHRDNRPAGLAVQVLGKPGVGHSLTAIVRFAPLPKIGAAGKPRVSMGGNTAGPAMSLGAAALLSRAASRRMESGDGTESLISRMRSNLQLDAVSLRTASKAGNSKLALALAPAVGGPGAVGGLTPRNAAAAATLAGLPAHATESGTGSPMPPGASALAAGVACVISARGGIEDGRPGGARRRGGAAGGGGSNGTAASTPTKPLSPDQVAGADKPQPDSPRTAALLSDAGPPPPSAGGGSRRGLEAAAPGSPPPKRRSPLGLAARDDSAEGGDRPAMVKDAEAPKADGATDREASGDGSGGSVSTRAALAGAAEAAKPPEKHPLRAASVSSASSHESPRKGGGEGRGPGLDHIKKWVATDGEFYQNTAHSVASTDWDKTEGGETERDDDDSSPRPTTHAAMMAVHSITPDKAMMALHAGPDIHGHEHDDDDHPDQAPGRPSEGEVPHEVDDARSEGGDSQMSGMSGTSGVSDADIPADFKRGKRYRALIKLMDSPAAQRAVIMFKLQSFAVCMISWAVHVLCFALIVTAVRLQTSATDQLLFAGQVQRYVQKSLVAVRGLDQVYRGYGSNYTYGIANSETFADDILEYSSLYRNANSDILMNVIQADIEQLYYRHPTRVWTGRNATTGLDVYEDMSLWDLVTRYYTSSRTVYQNHLQWYQQGVNISATLEGEFLLRSCQTLMPASRLVLDQMLVIVIDRTNYLNSLQLAFLLLEGCVMTTLMCISMVYLLNKASELRYKLYETFLTIPIGLTRALASETAHLLDDDESEDEGDDDEGSARGDGHEGGGSADAPKAPRRKALFESNGADSEHESVHGGRGDPLSPLPRGGGGAAGKTTTTPVLPFHAKGDAAGPHYNSHHATKGGHGLDDSAKKLTVKGGDVASPEGHGHNRRASALALQPLARGSSSAHFSAGAEGPGGIKGWWAQMSAKIWHRNAVHPAPTDKPRRTLRRNSRVVSAMLAIAITYSLLIIIFYSICYVMLLAVGDMGVLQAVAEHSSERTYRCVYMAQELVAELDPAMRGQRIADLRNATVALRDAYHTLRIGPDAWRSMAPNGTTESFYSMEGDGIAKETAAIFSLFYGQGNCLRMVGENPDCPPSSYRYYQLTHSGVDAMMQQFLLDLGRLADAASSALTTNGTWPNHVSGQWDYVYNVGTLDLCDGNRQISLEHMNKMDDLFAVVVILHVMLFLLLVGLFAGMFFCIIQPMLRRMRNEKRRIAEMMSQLPPELDVQRLVTVALLGASAHVHHHNRKQKPGAATGGGAASSAGAALSAPAAAAAAAATPTHMAAAAPATAAATAAMEPSHSLQRTASGGEGTGPEDANGAAGGGSKAYHAWKDILQRANSAAARASLQVDRPANR